MAASALTAATNVGLTGSAVRSAELMLGMNMHAFAKKVVLKMAAGESTSAAAGKLNMAAVNMGASSLITELSSALLIGDHIEEAAEITAAFWDAALESNMEPLIAASSMAASVVIAVDAGHAASVAAVQRLLLERNYANLVVWLTVGVCRSEKRPDAVAKGTLEAVKQPGGKELAATVAAMTMAEGFYDVAAESAAEMYTLAEQMRKKMSDGGGERSEDVVGVVVEIVGRAARQAIAVQQVAAVVEVSQILAVNSLDLVVGVVVWMVENGNGNGLADAAKVTVCAVKKRKFWMTWRLVYEMVRQGKGMVVLTLAGATGTEIGRSLFT